MSESINMCFDVSNEHYNVTFDISKELEIFPITLDTLVEWAVPEIHECIKKIEHINNLMSITYLNVTDLHQDTTNKNLHQDAIKIRTYSEKCKTLLTSCKMKITISSSNIKQDTIELEVLSNTIVSYKIESEIIHDLIRVD